MDQLHAYREAFQHLPAGCSAAEVHFLCKETTEVSFAQGKQKHCTSSEHHMLFVRASGKGTGVVYGENLKQDPQELIAAALENAKVVDAAQPQPMLKGCRDTHVDANARPIATQALMEKARVLSMKPHVVECSVSSYIRTSRVLNSYGTETLQRQPVYTVRLSVSGKGEDNFAVTERSASSLAAIDTDRMLQQLTETAILEHAELPYIQLPAGNYDTVISSNMTVNIMNTAWQLFSQRMMNQGHSPLKVGDVLGSKCLSIVDCPVCPWSGYDYTIDGEGVRGPKENRLVDKGVVSGTLRTLQYGNSTGCAGRADLLTANINTELIPVPRNIWIQPQVFSPKELITQMGTGIHLTYSMDEFHSLNIDRAAFSIPCGGVYYENGRAVGQVQQMNLYGSFRDLFAHLEAVGNDMQMRPMWPHYDYCFGGPSMLIRNAAFAM